jgi:hypothetical protein
MKTIKYLCLSAIVITIISCSGRTNPKGVYYGGPDLAPSVYYYVFEENGTMRVSQGKLETENCRTEGNWSTDEKGNITISGLNNPNCNFMSQLNGTYMKCDEPQCIPSGRGYIKGDLRIWPDDKK